MSNSPSELSDRQIDEYLAAIGDVCTSEILIHVNGERVSVHINSANQIIFSVNLKGLEIDAEEKAIANCCRIAPKISRLDSTVAQAWDDAFRTQPKTSDLIAVKHFIKNYPETSESLSFLLF